MKNKPENQSEAGRKYLQLYHSLIFGIYEKVPEINEKKLILQVYKQKSGQ